MNEPLPKVSLLVQHVAATAQGYGNAVHSSVGKWREWKAGAAVRLDDAFRPGKPSLSPIELMDGLGNRLFPPAFYGGLVLGIAKTDLLHGKEEYVGVADH